MSRKKSFAAVVVIFLFVNVFADNREKDEVHKLIRQEVYVLSNLNQIRMNDYYSYLMNLNDLDDAVDYYIKQEGSKTEKDIRNSFLYVMEDVPEDYVNLLEKGVKHKINWSEIDVLYSVSCLHQNNNSREYVYIYIENNHDIFKVQSRIARINEKYKLCSIISIEPVDREYYKEKYDQDKMQEKGGYFFDSL